MARIRHIKPEFFTSEDVSVLPLRARLTWIGLWTHCDDHGRTKNQVKLIKAAVWPLDDVSLRDVTEDLDALTKYGRIVPYTVNDVRYYAVQNWHFHQSINRTSRARFPPPPVPIKAPEPGTPGHCALCWSLYTHQTLSEPSLNGHGPLITGTGDREQGTGEGERAPARSPTPRCQRHTKLPADDPGPPCRICRDLRLAAEQTTTTPKTAMPPWCGECDQGTRLRENADRDPFRCPTCHPRGRKAAT